MKVLEVLAPRFFNVLAKYTELPEDVNTLEKFKSNMIIYNPSKSPGYTRAEHNDYMIFLNQEVTEAEAASFDNLPERSILYFLLLLGVGYRLQIETQTINN